MLNEKLNCHFYNKMKCYRIFSYHKRHPILLIILQALQEFPLARARPHRRRLTSSVLFLRGIQPNSTLNIKRCTLLPVQYCLYNNIQSKIFSITYTAIYTGLSENYIKKLIDKTITELLNPFAMISKSKNLGNWILLIQLSGLNKMRPRQLSNLKGNIYLQWTKKESIFLIDGESFTKYNNKWNAIK
ncbi:unnamed protein product [Rhizophagus irregularis]|nr:unnamed protein product [Rhizophagus irregularis]